MLVGWQYCTLVNMTLTKYWQRDNMKPFVAVSARTLKYTATDKLLALFILQQVNVFKINTFLLNCFQFLLMYLSVFVEERY